MYSCGCQSNGVGGVNNYNYNRGCFTPSTGICPPPPPPPPAPCRGPMGPMGPIGPMGPMGPQGPAGTTDYAYYTATASTYPTGSSITLTQTDTQSPTVLSTDGTNIVLPAGKYIVSYSFEGTGTDGAAINIVPTYNGVANANNTRTDTATTADLTVDMASTFAFTTSGTNLSFAVTNTAGSTAVTDVTFSVVVQKVA